MDLSIDSIEAVFEGIFNGGDSVQLGVVRSHRSAVITDKLFATYTEVDQ